MPKKEQEGIKYKKAPQAPRRFKSAYMYFSTQKHKSIRSEIGEKLQTTAVAKMVSHAWKAMELGERGKWEEMARRDKARYAMEKSMYKGPWKVVATKTRLKKDPNAPKRPMSAFLSFSNSRRAGVKSQHIDIKNSEISKTLAQMWKEAPEEERKVHIEKEFALRQVYKSAIATWRQNADEELKAERQKRENDALQRVDSPGSSSHQASISTGGLPDLPTAIQNLPQALGPRTSDYGKNPEENTPVRNEESIIEPVQAYPVMAPSADIMGYSHVNSMDTPSGQLPQFPHAGSYGMMGSSMMPMMGSSLIPVMGSSMMPMMGSTMPTAGGANVNHVYGMTMAPGGYYEMCQPEFGMDPNVYYQGYNPGMQMGPYNPYCHQQSPSEQPDPSDTEWANAFNSVTCDAGPDQRPYYYSDGSHG